MQESMTSQQVQKVKGECGQASSKYLSKLFIKESQRI